MPTLAKKTIAKRGMKNLLSPGTGRRQKNTPPRKNEENFHTFFTATDDIIIVASSEGAILYANPAASLKLGYRQNELRGMHILDLHPKEKREEANVILNAMFKGEKGYCPLPLRSKAGALIPVETRVWHGEWNGKACIFGMCKDLSKEQEALQKFSRLFNNNPCPMAVTTVAEGRFCDVNFAFLSTLGYVREEIIGRTVKELSLSVRPEEQREIAKQLERMGRIVNLGLKVKRKDGTVLDGLFSGVLIESQGESYSLTTMMDQTECRQAEDALRESEARWQFALEGAEDGVWDWNMETDEVFYSQRWKSMLGYAEDEIGNTLGAWDQRVHPEDKSHCYEDLAAYFSGKTSLYVNEHRVLCKDGSYKWILDRGKVVSRADDGKPLRMIGTHTDVTTRKQASEILERMVRERTAELFEKNRQLDLEIKERIKAEALLKKQTEELRAHTEQLTELNAALKVLLKKREGDKAELEEKVLVNVKLLLIPHIETLLKRMTDAGCRSILEILKANLNDIVSSFTHSLSSTYSNLTPTEIKVANLVREGKSIKEISEIMGISNHSINLHRFHLRKKLNLKSRKMNLRSHLLSLS